MVKGSFRGRAWVLGCAVLVAARIAHAAAADALPAQPALPLVVPAPVQVAQGVYVMQGNGDAVAPANRGVVANNGFIVGSGGVTVIDTGSSYRYGRAMIEAIHTITPLPIQLVIITHQAPEFVFGAAAFRDRDIPILAHQRAAELIRDRCAICLKNLRHTLGEEEMAGSRVTVPDRRVDGTTTIDSGGRALQLLHFGPASTPGDLAVLDTSTGVLFAGGLVSIGRIPELRNESIPGWLAALDQLAVLDTRLVVPGFGPPVQRQDIMQTGAYLRELDAGVRRAYASGVGLTEAMRTVQAPSFTRYRLYAIAQPANVQRLYLQLEKP
ncbi:MBL fold metallo-hydrolase [Paraburkholderia sp. GAS334]|uniref:MBL fold metallo-hydrolase n=1 Tax=Paraburkholderia sp. GAS334 TaxID=3035131 RepID=UPI003D22F5E3